MASANVTIGSNGYEFEADGTERTATLNEQGGIISNISDAGGANIIVNFEGAAIGAVAKPAGAGAAFLAPGDSIECPIPCRSYKFKGSASGYLKHTFKKSN